MMAAARPESGRAMLRKAEIWHGPFLEAQIRGAH